MTSIPAIFLTHDGYLSAAIFCLQQYARVWKTCPINFLVPVNSQAAADRLLSEAPQGLHIQIVACPKAIRATLASLADAAGDEEWVFWSSSDRYPISAADDALTAVTAAIVADPCSDALASFQAVRIVRWKEIKTIDRGALPVSVGGETFRSSSKAKVGFWQPQFVRLSWLRQLIAELAEDASLMDLQHLIAEFKTRSPQRPLICERPLMKLEEPIRKGKATINYAARQARKGNDIDGLEIEPASVAYSCLKAAQANLYWARANIDPKSVVARRLPGEAPFRVFSPGGVGARHILRWLQGAPDADPKPEQSLQSLEDWHWRIPPTEMRNGERCLYVFGDPRNTVVSIFNRREFAHAALASDAGSSLSNAPEPNFAIMHAETLEADTREMSVEWGLREYLERQYDSFRLEEHFDFWVTADTDYEVVFVRYETFWRNHDALRTYLGVASGTTTFRQRDSHWQALETPMRDQIETLHGSFARRLENLPDVFRMKDGVARLLDGEEVTLAAI